MILAEDNRYTYGGGAEPDTSETFSEFGSALINGGRGAGDSNTGGVSLIQEPPSNWMPLVVGIVLIKYMGWI